MQKSGFCTATGRCAANAYRRAVEGTAQIGTLLRKAVRAAAEHFSARCCRAEGEGRAAGAAAPGRSPEQIEAVFNHAMSRLQDPDPAVRAAAVRVFARLGKDESVARAKVLIRGQDPSVRAQAQEVLRELDRPPG